MTGEVVYAALAFVLSLALDIIPGLKDKWKALPKGTKEFGWLIASLGVPMGLWALACYAGVKLFFEYQCDVNGFVVVMKVGLVAYGLSQGTHKVVKKLGLTY